MSENTSLPKKLLIKWRKEDIELHKRVLNTELHVMGASFATRKKFFILYNHYINPKNILCYFHRPASMFIKALIRDELDEISQYIPKNPKKTKRKCLKIKSKLSR